MMYREQSRISRLSGIAVLGWTVGFFMAVIATPAAQAQYTVLYNFSGGADGANPFVGVTLDSGGNIYGTAYAAGGGYGTVFKLTHKGSGWGLNPLYSFKGKGANDGAGPNASIVIGPDGILYGSTIAGGGNEDPYCQVYGGYLGCGTVFSLRPSPTRQETPLSPWTETLLHLFTFDPDGAYPLNSMVFDQAGNLYGTGANGGYISGVVWELSPSGSGWNEQAIYTFTGLNGGDGGYPEGGVTFDSEGNLYGTTSEYGHTIEGCCGAVFQLVPSESGWTENTLYDFTDGDDGSTPYGGVIADSAGNLYGTTTTDGANGGGTVFELSPSGSGYTFQTIYSFSGTKGQQVGPYGNLVMDSAGNLYGTTYLDGRYGWGNVFKLTPSGSGWTYASIHDFTGGTDGAAPRCGLVFDSSGNLYGTTSIGGANGYGVVFRLVP
ncbi:MAG: choice-of-anchor tandem repeat GloVer-containing protein [Candidatus Korobacteraceae bacterium]